MIVSSKPLRTGLTEEDTTVLWDIFRKYASVKEVKVFGSRANGKYKPGSDIDLVILNADFNKEELAQIKSDFEESSLPYFIDLIIYQTIINENLKDHINKFGLDFYSAIKA